MDVVCLVFKSIELRLFFFFLSFTEIVKTGEIYQDNLFCPISELDKFAGRFP